MGAHILVCDDEELIRWSLAEHLQGDGYRVTEAEDGQAALEAIARERPDLVLTDLKMPRMDGLGLLANLREAEDAPPVVVLTAYGAVDSAVEATRLGARAYLTKPFDLREITIAVEKALSDRRLEQEVHYLRARAGEETEGIVGDSPAMMALFDTIHRVQEAMPPTIMVCGESGTGKDLIANAIHHGGGRAGAPFMEVDCTSLPEQLIESELFGHERGAFTDARTQKIGLFEKARGGTIFLDEIGEMSPKMQTRLLRALENRRFRRVGGTSPIELDATIVAATNRDLRKEVRDGNFREDLFFRLDVIRIDVPPLRARLGDVPQLVAFFLERYSAAYKREVTEVSGPAMERLKGYRWPGNVRELRNLMERMVILGSGKRIELDHLPVEIRRGALSNSAEFQLPTEGIKLEEVERSFIEQALERTGGNQTAAARLLGISRYALRYRMEKFGLKG